MEYKILTFRCVDFKSINKGRLSILTPTNEYCWEGEIDNKQDYCTLKSMMKVVGSYQEIYTIERSDGVTFTIGDMINTHGEIKRLRLTNDGMYQFSCQDVHGWKKLDNVSKEDHIDFQRVKDYKILHVMLKDGKTLLTYDGEKCIARTDKCSAEHTKCLSSILYHDGVSIQTVQRLSDGHVFGIGDKITTSNNYDIKGKIDKIIICQNPSSDVVASLSKNSKGKLFFCVLNNNGNIRLDEAVKVLNTTSSLKSWQEHVLDSIKQDGRRSAIVPYDSLRPEKQRIVADIETFNPCSEIMLRDFSDVNMLYSTQAELYHKIGVQIDKALFNDKKKLLIISRRRKL